MTLTFVPPRRHAVHADRAGGHREVSFYIYSIVISISNIQLDWNYTLFVNKILSMALVC